MFLEPAETTILGAPSARYERVTDTDSFKKYLKEKFPSEEQGIEEYFRSIKEANVAFDRSFLFKSIPLPVAQFLTWTGLHKLIDGGYSKWASISLQKALENMTQNKELQALLAANFPDHGCDPSRSPFIMHAAMVSVYRHGAYYPHGGPSTIATKIIKNLVAHQSQVMVCANVKRVVLEQKGTAKLAKGVEMMDGIIIEANTVVSDAGIVNTAKHLLPPGTLDVKVDDDHISRTTTEHLHPSQTFLSLFVGLSASPETLNLPKGGIFFIHASNDLTGNVQKVEKMSIEDALRAESIAEAMEGEDLHLGPIFVNPSCVHDKSWSQKYPEKSTLEILVVCPYSWFAKYESDRGHDYEQLKTRLADKIWKRVVEVLEVDCPNLPKGLEGMDHFQIGSPLTNSRLLGGEHGAAYGLEHNMKRFEPSIHYLRLRPKLPEVSGLYLTGQDIATAGFPAAMMGGLQCAATMLQVADPFALLRAPEALQSKL
jgi:all-trans-retinol 13,14-reductase